MTKTTNNEYKIKKSSDIPNDSSWQKPNLKGDWCNIFLLVLLYTIQGIPCGFSAGLPIILQSKYMVTYDDQVSLNVYLLFYFYKYCV